MRQDLGLLTVIIEPLHRYTERQPSLRVLIGYLPLQLEELLEVNEQLYRHSLERCRLEQVKQEPLVVDILVVSTHLVQLQ